MYAIRSYYDMHGYQEDTVQVKPNKRKETFRNTTEDSFHCAFASTCNFYIINDNKSYNKTKQIYKRLGINTIVFKPNEFIEHYNNFLNVKNSETHINILFGILESSNFSEYRITSYNVCYTKLLRSTRTKS